MIVKIDWKLIEEIFYILTEATLSSRDHYNENEFCLLLESNSLESLNKIINSDNFITYWYYHSKKLVWFVILDMNTNWLSKIFVSPDYQSMWIWKKLLNFSLDLFKNHWLSFLYLIARNN